MKFQVYFKTPDVLDSVIRNCQNEFSHKECETYDPDCAGCLAAEDIIIEKIDRIRECAEKFIEYNEYICVEFDTETQTAIVIPVKTKNVYQNYLYSM